MYIAILGRQPGISMAELERCYGSTNTRWFSPMSAMVDVNEIRVEQLGGTVKAGKITLQLTGSDWRKVSPEIIRSYSQTWSSFEGKITLGISTYGFDISAREVQKVGIVIKQNLKKHGVSLRLIPNAEATLNTATSHHNKLGLSANKVELLIVRGVSGRTIVAESVGAQNITALARRDQGRPKRDAFVGMLPPKLAMIMLNLAASDRPDGKTLRVLDPFCGTGVVLQEAALRGYDVYGTDLSEKMVSYTQDNLEWLERTHHTTATAALMPGDAMNTTWEPPIDLVVSETYLGQPFSASPSPKKLIEVSQNVEYIFTSFLKNIRPQLESNTPLVLAVPAWRHTDGHITRLPLKQLNTLGYVHVQFSHVSQSDLLYYREDQIVARELLVLVST